MPGGGSQLLALHSRADRPSSTSPTRFQHVGLVPVVPRDDYVRGQAEKRLPLPIRPSRRREKEEEEEAAEGGK